jgi:hypothetical protein
LARVLKNGSWIPDKPIGFQECLCVPKSITANTGIQNNASHPEPLLSLSKHRRIDRNWDLKTKINDFGFRLRALSLRTSAETLRIFGLQ